MIRNRLLALAALAVAGGLTCTGIARAGEPVPSARAPAAKAAPAPTTPAEAPKTKTNAPIWSMMSWVGKQVAPDLECACPSTEAGEKAWRAWYAGGKDVPLAALRDRMVEDGWTADAFVTFFKEMAAKKAAGAGCDCGDKKTGGCDCKGEGAEGHPCCPGCKGKKDGAATPPATPPAKPEEAPKNP